MALYPQTLDGLRSRIITETVRNDLADDLASLLDTEIASAIGYYENERWWFNESRTTGVLTIGQEYTPLPSNFIFIDSFYITVGMVRYELTPRSMEYIEDQYTVPQVGQPTDYAVFGPSARLWPTPNLAFPTIWLTVGNVTPVLDYGDGSSANFWTQQGADLIVARVKMNLYRDQFRDADGLALSTNAESAAYKTLKGDTNRRVSTGKIRYRW